MWDIPRDYTWDIARARSGVSHGQVNGGNGGERWFMSGNFEVDLKGPHSSHKSPLIEIKLCKCHLIIRLFHPPVSTDPLKPN